VQMDGFAPTLGVVVIGATNRPDILDPALLRPGRFDRHVVIETPDVGGRLEILKLHARSRRLGAAADLSTVAKTTPGFTGADLANVLNEGALLAVRRRALEVGPEDLAEAVQRVQAGPRRRGRLLTEDEVRRIAYHEAGHAVVASASDYPGEVERVSIVARGRTAAQCNVPRSDRVLLTRSQLLDELTILLSGLAAEELEAGEASTASEADIERATDVARQFAGRYGMSDEVGIVRVVRPDAEVFLGRDYLATQAVSSATLERIDAAVRELIAQAKERALQVLQGRRGLLDAIAGALVERETLSGDEVDSIVAEVHAAASVREPRSRR
jgi:cell division protease FtsH